METITPTKLKEFLQQPGINVNGICSEAGIAKQPLYKCLREERLPGKAVLGKLVPVMVKYGYRFERPKKETKEVQKKKPFNIDDRETWRKPFSSHSS